MQTPHLTLYHYWRSSCSWRVRWALALKGLSYDSQYVNLLKGEQKLPTYLDVHPAGYIPALVVEEGQGVKRVFGESLAILEWLEERWPTPSLLPPNSDERAWVRQLALTVATQIQPLQNPLVLDWVMPLEKDGAAVQREKHLAHWNRRGLKVYEDILRRSHYPVGPYSLGAKLTFADLCLIPQVYSAYRFKADISDLPLVTGIYQRCMELESCMLASPERQKDAPKT